jgi:lipoate-protein ligase B
MSAVANKVSVTVQLHPPDSALAMSCQLDPRDDRQPVLQAHLLGVLDFGAALALQQRLVYEAGGRRDRQIALLLCEHPACITVGRQGSRADIRLGPRGLASRRLTIRWVNRGGGAVIHSPGQLAVYPIVPLERRGWTVGAYIDRLQAGVLGALAELSLVSQARPEARGVWGRTGQLAAIGVAVKDWIGYHGVFVNVGVPGELLRLVNTDAIQRRPMSSLAIERQQTIKMTAVRECVLRHLSAAFECERYHLHTGHNFLPPALRGAHDSTARAG